MNRRSLLVVAVLCACKSSETSEPPPPDDPPVVLPPEACTAPNVDAPRTFVACSTGSGNFGRWTIDDLGLPAYDYAIDQWKDDRALFPNTEGLERRDHWHAFGNDRVNAIFVNDGYVQVATQDRGVTWLNLFDEEKKNFAGGFSWIDDGATKWSSAHRWRPRGSIVTRRFGATYAETTASFSGTKLVRRLFAPSGDAPAVIDDVVLENTSSAPKTLRHYEFWDVARQQLRGSWFASGVASATVPSTLSNSRKKLNAYWDETPSWDAATKTLRIARKMTAEGASKLPAPDAPSDYDVLPGDPYLAVLVGDVAETWTDQKAFFGEGTATLPDAVRDRGKGAIGSPQNGIDQPFTFVVATDVTLAPGEKKHLRFAYGYSKQGAAPEIDPSWRDEANDLRKKATDAVRDDLAYFANEKDPWLQREMAWHALQMDASVGYREYWGRHVVPQGSAYLYLHGVDGAPRDIALFALPLVYTRPALAREMLLMMMGLTHKENARMTYAFHGHGFLDDAIVHTAPSDLYIFFLLAMTEYIEATGDISILDEIVSFHPKAKENEASGFSHVQLGVRHLFDTVGTGEHGLIRVQTGDWSDGIVASSPVDRALAISKGESVPNTQMAAYVLPRAAKWIRARDAALADEMETKAKALFDAASKQWAGKFYTRAFFGDGKAYGADEVILESQVWALIANMPDATQRATLVDVIKTRLDAPSPAGTFLFEPPKASPEEGQVWPAIGDLLPWGYASFDESLAWNAFTRHTLTAHALAFPDTWSGIWSAADGHYGKTGAEKPGVAWKSVVTPMTDFPVMNMNAHAMPLFALLRVCGIEPMDGGLRIAPHVPGRTYSLDTRLVRLDVRPTSIHLEYRAIADGKRTIEIVADTPIASAKLDGSPVTFAAGSKTIRVDISTSKGKSANIDIGL